jgi:hypothetical protein
MRAGESDLVDARMRSKRRASRLAKTGHHVDDTSGNAGLHAKLSEPQRGQRRLFRRLQDHRAAGRNRRTDLPDAGAERAIPGNDRADDADRLFQGVGEYFARQRVFDGLAVDRGRLTGIITEHAEHAEFVAAGAADRRAHVERVELRQLLEILLDEIGEFQKQALPLERLDLAPGTFEGAASRDNRAVDILGVAFGHGRQQFTCRGIKRLEFLAGSGIDPLAVDQHLLVGTIGVGMARDRNCLRNSHGVFLVLP